MKLLFVLKTLISLLKLNVYFSGNHLSPFINFVVLLFLVVGDLIQLPTKLVRCTICFKLCLKFTFVFSGDFVSCRHGFGDRISRDFCDKIS